MARAASNDFVLAVEDQRRREEEAKLEKLRLKRLRQIEEEKRRQEQIEEANRRQKEV
jgi:hypothetical protein